MAVNLKIYSNASQKTKNVTFDFTTGILADSLAGSNASTQVQYYFKFTTSARDTDGDSYPVEIVKSLDQLALNGVKQSATDESNAYTDINSMIIDYSYDYLNGHTDDQFSSGVEGRPPMDFS